MPLYWHITHDCAGEYRLTLRLCYTDDELARGVNVTEANLVMFRNRGGSTWENQGGTAYPDQNCVMHDNVTSLSYWTVGDPTTQGPTVIALRSLSARNDPPPPSMVWLFALSAVWIAGWLLRRRSRRGFRF